ncbi:protein eva-1 homolog C-like isoform X2 [Lathamus discolor]|uniref:protein eva-1 homolog C-like isoform X2 n=1 Tax=Lathamus discolor TaxID=678569 RepID=UPI0032B7D692
MAGLVGPAAALVLLCLATGLEASPELSGYLRKVLRNHTTHTCDGEQLLIVCPHRTTISILGAFYGRRVPSPNLCPSPGNDSQESTECVSTTAHLKLLAECQDQQWCQFSVHSQVFGPDPCPGTHKYLIVSYKCRPGNHRVKTVCENDKLRLQCRPKSVLAIYSANYGRFLRGKPECDALNAAGPHIECLAPDALRRVSRKCHRRGNCTVAADQATFGDPCLPGMKKQLRVSYTCVPKQLLEEAGPDTSDPFLLSDYMHGIVRGRLCQKPRVHACVNQAFLGLSVPMVPTSDTHPTAPSQHHSPVANATHQSVPTSEQLEGCAHWELRRGGPSRSILQAEKHLCRKEGEWHGDGGRQPAAGHWGAPCASARIPLSTTGGWYKGPRFSRLREDRMFFTSTLAAFAHLWGVPEKVGLYFLCGVSGGLLLLLCIVSPKTTFLQEVGEALRDPELGSSSELGRTKLQDEQDEDLPDDSSSDSSFRRLTHTYRATDSIFSPELTAAMEGAVEHQGHGREEIWMPKESSPYAIHKIKSATK